MKISIDDVELFTLTTVQNDVICNDVCRTCIDDELKRRIEYIVIHKYEQCFNRLKNVWDSILAERYETIPTNASAYAQLVFSQPDYKDRYDRELKSQGE